MQRSGIRPRSMTRCRLCRHLALRSHLIVAKEFTNGDRHGFSIEWVDHDTSKFMSRRRRVRRHDDRPEGHCLKNGQAIAFSQRERQDHLSISEQRTQNALADLTNGDDLATCTFESVTSPTGWTNDDEREIETFPQDLCVSSHDSTEVLSRLKGRRSQQIWSGNPVAPEQGNCSVMVWFGQVICPMRGNEDLLLTPTVGQKFIFDRNRSRHDASALSLGSAIGRFVPRSSSL